PATNQVTQYLVLYLPLIALTLCRLRERPTWKRAGAFGLVLLLAVFSSYYMAVLAGVTVLLWSALELLRREPRRFAFVVRLVAPVIAVAGLLVSFSMPYFARHAESHEVATRQSAEDRHPGMALLAGHAAPAKAGSRTGPHLTAIERAWAGLRFWGGR